MDALARVLGYLLTLLALLSGAVCGPDDTQPPPEASVPQKTIEQVLDEHTDRLLALPGVVGTAQGECNGAPCIKILVVEETPELWEQIPDELDGYPVEIQTTGEIRALEPS